MKLVVISSLEPAYLQLRLEEMFAPVENKQLDRK